MNRTKIIGRILFYITSLLGSLYLIITLYALICLLTGWNTASYGNGMFLHINYPFTITPLMNVDNNVSYKVFSFLLPLSFYTIFFLLSAQIFKLFTRRKLFTKFHLLILKRYYRLNILLPIVCTAIAAVFVTVEGGIAILIAVHFILGIFVFFLAEIFRQGLHLQDEQDLYI
ncbi:MULTISPECIES: DUF2975 domain-containing protein [Sphingobacterium]|jgi:hypothetical protein|uniref:DUF2975 domain-containing protein n=1 Tax=Sphingobacterium TaxID=28453 RepID=UPI0008A1F975|nr:MULTISPECIES: DUF2975 domain-containing protein [Sphingobacterium]HAF32978.1 DUF2975 domain-containing protein [Sphingobacterium sp.]MDF2850503.1 hypothetical protein [Sphingobacterium multivorum]OFV20794.1 hypothetical protein HMPREF3127_01515 [Sphingobacterium sp. HMSC13C05]QQT61369.1 DUF2975 domain-containing protein [Sphingobacterium multivorum]HAK29982.1 DUF2975 domain-containing protein [Sphingobacterium sp.]